MRDTNCIGVSCVMKTYENLVFGGGGVKGSAYAGSLEVLEELGLYGAVKCIGGTSTGAITAAVLATGGGSEGLRSTVESSNFHDFIQDGGGVVGEIFRGAQHYGIHSGVGFEKILQGYIERFSGNANLTFQQLFEKSVMQPSVFKNLTIVASNLSRQRPETFSASSHPDLPIWQAVRASMSIPLVFEPMRINNEFYVDGGLSWNYPVDLFDKTAFDDITGISSVVRNPSTLGFYLQAHNLMGNNNPLGSSNYTIDSLKDYALAIGAFFMDTSNAKHVHPDDGIRTVFVDDLGTSAIDFSASKERIEALIESGRKATEEFFKESVLQP